MPHFHSAGVSGTQDHYAGNFASQPTKANTRELITPYLGWKARLSQIWINRWTVLLLLVLVRVLLSITSMNDGVGDAREKALSACTKVESAGSALASMPFYMSRGLNEITASGVEKAVNGLMSMLTLIITAVQEIVLFYINMLTGTYVCLITLAVNGAMSAALMLVEKTTEFLNKALPEIGKGIGDVIEGFQGPYNELVDGIGKISSLPFSPDFNIPKLDMGDTISKLDDVKIPTDFLDDVRKLNESVPDFKDVQNFTDNIIRTPFLEIKKLIKNEMDTYTFDRSMFPVPKKEQLNFCSEGNGLNDFFDSLVELLHKGKKIFLGVILTLAILVCVPMAWLERRRYDNEGKRAAGALKRHQFFDPREVVYVASRPTTSQIGSRLGKNETTKSYLIRWVVAYATSPPAMFILSLAIAGAFSCLCQLIMLRTIQTQVPDLTQQVAGFTEKVTLALNDASMAWQNGTNLAIKTANDDINGKVFGWVDTSTTAVNGTLNAFVDKMTEGIDKVFGNTILKDPIQGVINCLIVYKIEGIQKGLTWVHDNAHINFPSVRNDTFSLGALASMSDSNSDDQFLLAPGQKTKDELTELIDKLVRKFESRLVTEAAISAGLLAVWLLIALIGIIWALFQGWSGTGIRRDDHDVLEEDLARARANVQPTEFLSPTQAQQSTKENPFDDGFSAPPLYTKENPNRGQVATSTPEVVPTQLCRTSTYIEVADEKTDPRHTPASGDYVNDPYGQSYGSSSHQQSPPGPYQPPGRVNRGGYDP